MSTTIKITRPTRLTDDETLTSFEDWRNNLNFYLSQDKDFKIFLKPDATWVKTSTGIEHRGLDSADSHQQLQHFLGVIAGLCPPLLYNEIIDETTKTSDIFKLLRTYYQFAPSESTFMKYINIRREVKNGSLERPLHLYLRFRQFIRDNLLLSSGKIEHNGAVPTTDETLSATTERLIVLRWLEILHPGLPNHVINVFAQDLQTKSLKDLQPRINEQIEDLLLQVHNKTEDSNVNLSYARFSDNNRFVRNSYNSNQRNNTSYNRNRPFDNRKQNSDAGNRNAGEYSKSTGTSYPSRFKSKPKTCEACRSVQEPYIGHEIQNCPKVLPADRQNLLKSFALEVGEEITDDVERVPDDEEYDTRSVDLKESVSNSTRVQRVDIVESPQFNVKIKKTMVTMVLDTGATGSMISLDLCKLANLEIYPSSHSAILADGDSRLEVVGEVHTSITMEGNVDLTLNALAVTKLKAGLIVGMSFMKQHGVVIDIPHDALLVYGKTIHFNNLPGNPKVSLLRTEITSVVLPGESLTIPIPSNFSSDKEVAVEPREFNSSWPEPSVLKNDGGFISIPNFSDDPVKFKRNQVIAQIRSVVAPPQTPMSDKHLRSTKPKSVHDNDYMKLIKIDPDGILADDDKFLLQTVTNQNQSVFNPQHSVYNEKSGKILADVVFGNNTPPPKKGKVPSYNTAMLDTLQEKIDELVEQGVLSHPEDVNVTVAHISPSFLVKKTDKSTHRLVTSFVELNKYIRELPSKLDTTEDVLTALGRWKYIIKTDLKSAYFQIRMDPACRKWLGTISPYKGTYVYNCAPNGLKNMAEYLEELLARVLGDCLAEGILAKIADDLFVGGVYIKELASNWRKVLQKLKDNNLSLSPDKTFICPARIRVAGWIWNNGNLEVDPHRINPLTVCSLPEKVKQMRSFIGAYRAFSRCVPGYAKHVSKLEDVVAGKESAEKLTWNDELRESFKAAQKALSNPRTLVLPSPDDQLILVSDGCNSPPAVGSTLYVKRGTQLLVAGFFSSKIKKHQILWLPCEIEALCITLSVNAFSNLIRESKHTTKCLTDSKTCAQAFEKLSKGGFSLSPRISSFLMNLNALNISLNHISGSDIQLTDFNSRNPVECVDKSCQVCKFVEEHIDIAVRGIKVDDIENGSLKMPFRNFTAWKDAQKNDPDLKRTHAQLTSGTRPGKKEKYLKAVRRYLQVASVSNYGLLIHRKPNLYGSDFELIIVPQNLAPGLISALHVRLGHPTKSQFKKLWDRYFFAIKSDEIIDNCTTSCSLCCSLKSLPTELFAQSTSSIPAAVGVSYSADVIRRERQKIIVLIDKFSSFVAGQLISDEKHETLQQSIIQLSMPFKHVEGCVIRVDNAPGFLPLTNDELLSSLGIALDFGRIKNKNQNPTVDKIIQEVESEIKRLSPHGDAISSGTLAIALSNTNGRIRFNGLSASEVVTKRDRITNQPLNFDDEKLCELKYTRRIQNHKYSEKSKSKGHDSAVETVVEAGDIVHLKSDGSKHCAREFYFVTSVNHNTSEASVQKLLNNQFRGRKYEVKFSEIYLAQMSPNRDLPSGAYDSDEDIALHKNSDCDMTNEPVVPLRRSARIQNRPEYLATKEIERV